MWILLQNDELLSLCWNWKFQRSSWANNEASRWTKSSLRNWTPFVAWSITPPSRLLLHHGQNCSLSDTVVCLVHLLLSWSGWKAKPETWTNHEDDEIWQWCCQTWFTEFRQVPWKPKRVCNGCIAHCSRWQVQMHTLQVCKPLIFTHKSHCCGHVGVAY